MADTYISRAATGSVTSSTTFTFSFWLKRGDLNRTQTVFMHENASGHYEKFQLELQSDNTFRVSIYDGSTEFNYDTNMLFRDTSGWYNIVVRWDTTQSTSTDRVRIYVNGSQITFDNANGSTATMPNQNFAINLGEKIMVWGRYQASSPGAYFNGSLSYCQYADGQSYAPTTFGSIDSTTGEWKLNTNATVTYGNNGFFILKNGNRVINDAGNSSGNFAVSGGTLTKTEDSPSNVFTTMNPLNHDYANTDTVLENGNTYVKPQSNSNYNYAMSTLAMPKGNGKFYFEVKNIQYDNIERAFGIVNMDYASEIFYQNRRLVTASNNTYIGRVFLTSAGHSIISGTANSGYGTAWTSNDILSMACDMENGAFYFRKNGDAWLNSGVPTSGSTKTGAIDISSSSQWTTSSDWGIWCGDGAANHDRFAWNFGNGYFQTTAVSSAGTNASGNGIFEYDVPTGYTALSTKGLNL